MRADCAAERGYIDDVIMPRATCKRGVGARDSQEQARGVAGAEAR